MTCNKESYPLVSVVIPTYERPEYLEGAIQTALGQTYENIEVIVVDDGSTELYVDDTVATFPESVVCVRHNENKGLSAARNTGIRNSDGKYVAFLDDDDRWHRTKLSRQVAPLEREPEAGLATCFIAAITPDNELVHCSTSAPEGDCSDELLVRNCIGSPSRVVVRRDCFNDVGLFDESLPTKQDWDFYIRLSQNWQIVAVKAHLCFRTIHESMSSSPDAVRRDKKAVAKKQEKLIRASNRWKQTQAAIDEEVGRTYLDVGDLKEARRHLRKSLTLPNIKRLVLFSLSFTHPSIVESVTQVKRKIALQLRDCSELEVTSDTIPGLRA